MHPAVSPVVMMPLHCHDKSFELPVYVPRWWVPVHTYWQTFHTGMFRARPSSPVSSVRDGRYVNVYGTPTECGMPRSQTLAEVVGLVRGGNLEELRWMFMM